MSGLDLGGGQAAASLGGPTGRNSGPAAVPLTDGRIVGAIVADGGGDRRVCARLWAGGPFPRLKFPR